MKIYLNKGDIEALKTAANVALKHFRNHDYGAGFSYEESQKLRAERVGPIEKLLEKIRR